MRESTVDAAKLRGKRSHGGGFFDRLARWLSGTSKPAQSRAANPANNAVRAAAVVDKAIRGENTTTIDDYVTSLGIPLLETAELSPTQRELSEQIAGQVFQHFRTERGAPMALPSSSLRVLNLAAQHDVDVAELSRTVSQDPAMTTAVLRVANSAAVAGASAPDACTVRESIARLGTTEVSRIAGAVAARTLFNARSKAEQALFAARFRELHHMSACCASGAALLSMQARQGRSDMAYLGGMLHEVGKSIALGALAGLILEKKAPHVIANEVVDDVLERVHVEIGIEAHEAWSLPNYLSVICAGHHGSVSETHTDAELNVVRVVSGLLSFRAGPHAIARREEWMQSLRALHLNPKQMRAFDAELMPLTERLRLVLA